MSIHNIFLCIDKKIGISISLVQSLSHVWLFATPWTAAQQASLSFTNSQNLFKLKSIKLMMLSNHLILCHPPSPPALNLSPNQGLFQWVSYSHHVATVLELRGGGVIPWRRKCQWKRYNRYGFDPWVGKISWRRAQQPTPVFLPENPMDREAWWATVHGIPKSRT